MFSLTIPSQVQIITFLINPSSILSFCVIFSLGEIPSAFFNMTDRRIYSFPFVTSISTKVTCFDYAKIWQKQKNFSKKKLQELSEFDPSFGFIKQLLPLPEIAAGLLPVLSGYQLWVVIRHHKVTNCWVCTLLLICLSATVHYMSKISVTLDCLLNFIIIVQLANLCQSSSLPFFQNTENSQFVKDIHFLFCSWFRQSSPWANRISELTGQGKENREERMVVG